MLRWQLAPHLTVAVLSEHSLVVRHAAGSVLATIFLLASAPARIVTRDVSPRLGLRVTAQCVELPLDSSLEALTIVVPAGGEVTTVSFELDAQHPERGICWADATGRHRVVTAPAQVPQLAPGWELKHGGLTWWVESLPAAARDGESALIAALPTQAPQVPGDVQAVARLAEQSGKMVVGTLRGRRWETISIVEPRRG
jgi:hypothetical protein